MKPLTIDKMSLQKALLNNDINLLDFPGMARKIFQLTEIEIPSSVFLQNDEQNSYLQLFKNECKKFDIQNLAIIIDNCGNINETSIILRNQAVQKHFKWIKALRFLGYNKLKIIISNSTFDKTIQLATIDGLIKLSDFAELYDVDIIVDSPDTDKLFERILIDIINEVNKPNCYFVSIGKQIIQNNSNTNSTNKRKITIMDSCENDDSLERISFGQQLLNKNNN